MKRDIETRSDLIEVGTVSVETKGQEGKVPDFQLGLTGTGLTDD